MADLNDVMNAVKSISDRIDSIEKTGLSLGNDTKSIAERVATLEKSSAETTSDVRELMQKSIAMPASAKKDEPRDLGSKFVLSNEYRSYKSSNRGKKDSVRLELASPIGTTTSNSVSINTFAPVTDVGIIADPRPTLVIESLFSRATVAGSSYKYYKFGNTIGTSETATGPAIVPEKSKKPETAYEGSVYLGSVDTIAHWAKLTEQFMEDDANIVSMINTDMIYEVNKKVDYQLLNGSGSGELGGLSLSGNYTDYNTLASLASGDTLIDVVRKVYFTMRKNAIDNIKLLLNPMDWCAVLGTKNDNKDYMISGIVDLPAQKIYGIPVIISDSVPVGKYFMGDFYTGGKIFERTGISLEMDRDDDDFTKNLITLRVERRLGFSVVQPKCIGYGNFAPVP